MGSFGRTFKSQKYDDIAKNKRETNNKTEKSIMHAFLVYEGIFPESYTAIQNAAFNNGVPGLVVYSAFHQQTYTIASKRIKHGYLGVKIDW